MEPKHYGFMNWWELIESRTIRHDIQTRPDLSRTARDLFAFLWRARKTLKNIVFGVKYMARELHCHPRTVQRAIAQLVAAGLLRLERRQSPTKHDPTSNRYFPHWVPYQNNEPQPVEDTEIPQENSTATPDTLASDSAPLIVPDSIENPPHSATENTSSMPGEEVAICRDPLEKITAESIDTQASSPSHPNPILDLRLRKNDQPGLSHPQALKSSQAPPSPYDDVIASIPNTWGLYTPRLMQWIEKFGLDRVNTVTQWVKNAPSGKIRHIGGWVFQALQENWSEPSWEIDRGLRIQATELRQKAIEAEMLSRQQEESARHSDAQAFDNAWTIVEPLLQEPGGDTLLQEAYTLAKEALKASTSMLFKPGSPIWRSFIIQAWRQRELAE